MRAKLFARLLTMQFGHKAKEYLKLLYRGKQALLQEVKLKMIERQLQKQQQELLRSMHIIAGKQADVAKEFQNLVSEVAVNTGSPIASPSSLVQTQGTFCTESPLSGSGLVQSESAFQCAMALAAMGSSALPAHMDV